MYIMYMPILYLRNTELRSVSEVILIDNFGIDKHESPSLPNKK